MRKICLLTICLAVVFETAFGQGYNHNYLIGYTIADPPWTFYDKGIIKIDNTSFGIFGLLRKMKFDCAQANIANDTGAVLFYTNGCWIANALEDTLLNGSGIATDVVDSQFCSSSGIEWTQSSLILPMPADSNRYVLFHHGNSYANPPNNLPLISYYSIIDMSLDNGKGGVVPGQKKTTLIQDKLLPGFAACKHSNGRDWWVVILRDSSDLIYKTSLTPLGVQPSVTESLSVPHHTGTGQLCFSPDGRKFVYRENSGSFGNVNNEVRVFDFNRCSGLFSNPRIVSWHSSYGSFGLAFSSNSKYLYTISDFDTVYQINTDTTNLQASMQVVAINDGYYSPQPPFQSNFYSMYLAANGKIVMSSGNGVVDLHYINYPDSGSLACQVLQHSLPMPCYTFQNNVNHPNYYLGCDTTLGCPCLITGANNLSPPDFKFRIYPNPVTSNNLHIGYLLPVSASSTSESGVFSIYDVTGKVVFKYNLPQWSNEQDFKLPQLSDGVYSCVITSGMQRVSKKIAVIKE